MAKLPLAGHNFARGARRTRYGRAAAIDNRVMDVTITQQPEIRVGTVRHIGPYLRIGRAFERLAALMATARRPVPAQLLALYYDDPEVTPADTLRSDAALSFPPGTEVPPGLIERRVAAGRYATTIHVGSYERLGSAWAALRQEIARHGWQPSGGVSYEIYLNDPATVPAAEQQTALFAPIE
jgi:AraC family transcriptional regulator